MDINRQNANLNHQDSPHEEGEQNNIPPIHHQTGQKHSNNNSHAMSNMMNDSPEQKTAPDHSQKDQSQVQQDERQP